jgi:3-oxoacyl-[acyl-carrier protein] reductase
MFINLENQVALVTGASRGIGQSIALSLGKQNAFVIGTATTEDSAQKISTFLKEQNVLGKGIKLDVNDNEAILKTVDGIIEEHGDISILVNNAGITKDMLLMRMKEEDWDDVMSTNLKSIFRMSQALIRSMMKSRYGRIINITSVVGHMGNAGQTNYAAAKAGVTGFTKSLAKEIGSRGITVNCVAPGFIDTDMTKGLSDEHKKQLLDHVPLGRLGSPEDIGAAVSFLASKEASYITGETLHVNGGMLMI